MYAQAAIKSNTLLRNGAYGIVMRSVQKCTRGCSSLRGRKRQPLCCIKLDTATDPACGTGGMLIEAIRYMHDDKLTYGKIYGQEKNLATSAIARMNLFLHGARDFKVTQGDTLRSPNYLERGSLQTFDCVVANPPFSLKNWGSEQFDMPPKS